jgi:hypothetical protein
MDARSDKEERTTVAVQKAFDPFAKAVSTIEAEIATAKGTSKEIAGENKFRKILQYSTVLAGISAGKLDVGNKSVMGAIKASLKATGLSRPTAKRLAENCRRSIHGNRQIAGLKNWLNSEVRTAEAVKEHLKTLQIESEADFRAEVNDPVDPVDRMVNSIKKLDEDEIKELQNRLRPVFEANT